MAWPRSRGRPGHAACPPGEHYLEGTLGEANTIPPPTRRRWDARQSPHGQQVAAVYRICFGRPLRASGRDTADYRDARPWPTGRK